MLNEQPAFGPPASSAVGGQSGSFGSGQSFINFFGPLGAHADAGQQPSLRQLEHRLDLRPRGSRFLQVDLNTIPTLMVDRLETIAVGGAPIYGADAIAGTVNIILKDRFEGVRFDAQMGIAEEGDAQEYRLGAMVGTSLPMVAATWLAAVEYNNTEGLLYTDRERTAQGLFYAAPTIRTRRSTTSLSAIAVSRSSASSALRRRSISFPASASTSPTAAATRWCSMPTATSRRWTSANATVW